jgi:hypothetical protein
MPESLNLHFEFPDTQSKERFKSALQAWIKQAEGQAGQQMTQQAGLTGGPQQAPPGESYGFRAPGQATAQPGQAGLWSSYVNFVPRW